MRPLPPINSVVCLLAEYEYPSFSGFPFIGLLLFLLFAATAAGAVGFTIWMEEQHRDLKIPGMERWYAGIIGLMAALLVATTQFGPLAVPVGTLAIASFMYAFAARRDKRVAEQERVLTRRFARQAVRSLRDRLAALRTRDKTKAAKPAPSLTDRLGQLTAALEKAGGRKRHAAATGVEQAAAAGQPTFSLLKKDGSPAIAGGEGSQALSANIQHVRTMLIAAMKAGATDIHLEPHEKEFFVRFRVDGVLHNSETMSMADGKGMTSMLKVASDMDIADRRRPQDGTFSALFGTDKYEIRAASTPTSYGEKMVLRLLNSSGGVMNAGLGNIGLRPQILTALQEVIHKPYGMFLVTGPTGSGKTTTVYASLNEIDANQHNITTIEDPVEYRLDGITQIAVNTAAGVTFASILRSVLRQDPDVLLVGEIRDKETAEIACQAALTGHFVFSTLHANDTVATITRMLDLGLDPMLIQTAVTAILAQRLARKLCQKCREPYPTPPDLLKRLGVKPEQVPTIYRKKGCPECGGTGYKGRVGIHELLIMSDDIRKLITESPSIEDLRATARHGGTRSLQVDGFLKVLKGTTSIEEIVRVTT
ncbi:MAG: GspE/PulE family protein [Planctomycetia bacterium]|jgi:general secretion pathway protein E